MMRMMGIYMLMCVCMSAYAYIVVGCMRVYIVRVCVSLPPVQLSPVEETSTQREWEPGTLASHAVKGKRAGKEKEGKREEEGGRRRMGGGGWEEEDGRRRMGGGCEWEDS